MISSGVKNDTIFLGFTFGMRSGEFIRKLEQLKNDGVLYFNDNREYSYEMQLSEGFTGTVEANLTADYFVDRLYKLTLLVEPTKQNQNVIYPSYIHSFLTKLYAEKYGYDYL